jgi:acetoin utilization protein AcuC
MSTRPQLLVPWDESLLSYDLGPDHPLAPVRVELTMALARDLGVLDAPDVELVGVTPATDEELELVHDPAYIAVVRSALEADPPSCGDTASTRRTTRSCPDCTSPRR